MSTLQEILLSSLATIVIILGGLIKIAMSAGGMSTKIADSTNRLERVEIKVDKLSDDVATIKGRLEHY